MPETISIIGAGIAGLSAGCYAQMNGYQSQIYELHSIPGGLCTSWRRQDYVFDGSIRYLSGTHPQSKVHRLWEELGLLEGREIHYYDEFTRYEGRDGRVLVLYTDIDRLEQHLLDLAPRDAPLIGELAEALRQFTQMELPVDLTPSDLDEMRDMGQDMLPVLWPVLRWRNVTIASFAARCRDPLLREALPQFFQFSRPDFPMMLMLTTLANMNDHEAGYPIGGSLSFSRDLARRYEALGGQIHCRSRVEAILTEEGAGLVGGGDRAVGVRLVDGSEHRSDIVISAADGHETLFDLLGGRYLTRGQRAHYRELPLARSILQISLGVDADFSHEPPSTSFPLHEPLVLGGVAHDRLVLKHYCFDPTMAPPLKSALSIWCEADYDHWARLRQDRSAYRAAKDEVARQVIACLERRFPGIAKQIDVVDVATPVTYERYTANWRGAFAGWALTTRKMRMMVTGGMRKTVPGLDGFRMIGQWVEPGGNVELAAASGRDVIKDLCRQDGRAFVPEEEGAHG
ncbi:MAG: NAD(P)/FAD-dependent oxidoreductase [Anaerolineae bacterium]|nr:NAD(P)/FAD-dependent oxidoreductase [Anaerolineae bacterium]